MFRIDGGGASEYKKCSGSLLFSFRSRALRLLKMWGKVFDNRQGPMIWRQAASKMLINLSISISSHLERRGPSAYEERRPHKVQIICTQTSHFFCNNESSTWRSLSAEMQMSRSQYYHQKHESPLITWRVTVAFGSPGEGRQEYMPLSSGPTFSSSRLDL